MVEPTKKRTEKKDCQRGRKKLGGVSKSKGNKVFKGIKNGQQFEMLVRGHARKV